MHVLILMISILVLVVLMSRGMTASMPAEPRILVPAESSVHKKDEVCIVVRGQMFRRGGQNSISTTYNNLEQVEAIQSMKKHVFEPFSKHWNVVVLFDVIADDMNRAYEVLNEIASKDGKKIINIRSAFPKTQVKGWCDSIQYALQNTQCKKLFVMRIDMLFKQDLPTETILRSKKPVLVPWRISDKFRSKLESGKDRVCDTFAFIHDTKTTLKCLQEHTNETSLHNIMDWLDCEYIIRGNYSRDSDSAKEHNDYYKLTGRKEAQPEL